jgi:lambda family phage portal protein
MNFREVPRLTAGGALAAIREEIKPNLLDRIIATISPERGVQRMKSKAMLAMGGWSGLGGFMGGGWFGGQGGSYPGGYTGARTNRRQTQQWRLRVNSADSDIIFDLPLLRDRSRDLIRNAPLATGAIGTVCQNVIGTGLQLQSQIEAETLGMDEDAASDWMSKTEREFRLWSESSDCDVTRTHDFYGLQNLAFRSALESGDVICLMPMDGPAERTPYTLRLQLIEADRLVNPFFQRNTVTFTGGVEMDEYGAPIAYHLMRRHPGSIDRAQALIWDKYPAFGTKTKRRNVIHLYDKTRPGQTRGIPYLTPVIETIKQLDRYTEAEVMAAVVAAMLTVFIKTEESEDVSPQFPSMVNGTGSSGSGGAASNDEVGLASGAIIELGPGEDVTTVNPNRPNTGYDLFVQSILRQIGIALGLPFEVLIKHFTASYSASRAALLDAWRFFRNRRSWVAQGFCQPIYEAWMDEAVATGRIKAPGYFSKPMIRAAYLQAQWLGEQPMQIDPVKEVEAAQKRLEIRVSTLAQETMQLNGGIWSDNMRQQTKERDAAVKAGLITSTTQVGPPMQRETITTAEQTIPDSQGEPGQKPVPAGQPGGGGVSPAPSKPAPQKPGQGAAKPANTPTAAPGKAASASAAPVADGTIDDLQNPGPKEKKGDEGTDSVAPRKRKKAKGAPSDPGEGSPSEKDDDSDQEEVEDENEGDGEDERKK